MDDGTGGLDAVEVVGEARSGTETLAEAHRLRPHLALIDVNLPGASPASRASRSPR